VARAIRERFPLVLKYEAENLASVAVAALTEAGRLAPEREEGDIERAIYWAACDMYERGDPVRFRRDIGDEFNWKSINPSDQDAWEALARLAYERFCDRGLFVPSGVVCVDAGRWGRVLTVLNDCAAASVIEMVDDAMATLEPGDLDAEPR